MSQMVDELLDAIDQALALMKKTDKARFLNEVDGLVKVKRVLEGLDPEEVEALLEDDEEEDRDTDDDDEDDDNGDDEEE
ncbi:MAG TPA: hypothetical protein VJV75_04715 [Candidatus Polarisedimenticolia bacterium]|nr:hypothetical protein [Candidatus Polarisedimenticolia bacterium]